MGIEFTSKMSAVTPNLYNSLRVRAELGKRKVESSRARARARAEFD